MKFRHIILGSALIATLAAVFWPTEHQDEELGVVEPVPRTTPAVEAEGGKDAVKDLQSSSDRLGEEDGTHRFEPKITANLFPRQTWVPPPPPPPKPPPPPPPSPPPLPFKYLGRWSEADGMVIFLAQGNNVLRIRGGEVLPGGWYVDEVQKNAVVFTYQSLNMQRTLGISP